MNSKHLMFKCSGGFLIEAKTGKTYLGEVEQSKEAIGEDVSDDLNLNRIEIVYDWPAKGRKNKKRRRRPSMTWMDGWQDAS